MMKKVYILDDDLDFLEMISYVLSKNYTVSQSTELDIPGICSFNPDLILMDHGIGLKSSNEIQKKLKEAIPGFDIPIILFSGHHNLPQVARRPGIAGFIQKPAGINEVREHLRKFFEAA